MDRWLKRLRQLLKYGLSGLAATLTQVGVLYVSSAVLGWYYLIGTTVGYLIAFVVSFVLQKYWTFRDNSRDRIVRQAAGHFTLGAVNLFANGGLMYLFHGRAGWPEVAAQIATALVVSAWSFLVYRYAIFHHDPAPEAARRIVIAAGIYPPEIGGPATYARLLKEKLPKHGLETVVVAYGGGRNEPGVAEVGRRKNKFCQYIRYISAVKRAAENAGSVYAMGPVSEGMPALIGARLAHRPFVLKVVGDYAWEQARQRYGVTDGIDEFQAKHYGFKTELLKRIERSVARRARTLVVPSEYLKKIVAGWGVPEERIRVIWNSVNLPPGTAGRTGAGGSEGRKEFIAITAGRLVPWKGVDQLIEIWPRTSGHREMRLVVAGDGPDRSRLENLVKKNGLEGRVEMAGALPHAELWRRLAAADVFILNSGYEGLSHTIIEAMALGLPVVASDRGGNPELVEDGVNGRIFRYGDADALLNAIEEIASDPVRARKWGEAGREKSAAFRLDQMVGKTVAALKGSI